MSKNEEEKNVFQCKSTNDYDCQDEFLDANPQLEYHKVDSDGNCFFRSLALYYSMTGEQIHGIHDPTDFKELRTYIVRKFGEMIRSNPEQRMILSTLNNRPLPKILSQLSKSCEWNLDAFEMMMGYVPEILHINLMIYRVNNNKNKETHKNEFTVTWKLFTPSTGPSATTISVFLAASHYGLILPRGGLQASSRTAVLASALAASIAKNKAASAAAFNNNAENAFLQYLSKPKRNTSKKAAVRSLSNSNASNNESVKAAIALSLANSKPKSKTSKKSKNASNNANLNAAIAASLANPKSAYNANLNAAIAASLSGMHIHEPVAPVANAPVLRRSTRKKVKEPGAPNSPRIANTKKSVKKSVKKQSLSVGMSFENIQEQLPYKTTTKDQIKQMLDDFGIAYSDRADKESLYQLLISVLLQ